MEEKVDATNLIEPQDAASEDEEEPQVVAYCISAKTCHFMHQPSHHPAKKNARQGLSCGLGLRLQNVLAGVDLNVNACDCV